MFLKLRDLGFKLGCEATHISIFLKPTAKLLISSSTDTKHRQGARNFIVVPDVFVGVEVVRVNLGGVLLVQLLDAIREILTDVLARPVVAAFDAHGIGTSVELDLLDFKVVYLLL